MIRILVFLLLLLPPVLRAQDLYLWPAGNNIESFLDELSNNHIIRINSVIKPYSRAFIVSALEEAKLQSGRLNERQKKELDFYLAGYTVGSGSLSKTVDLLRNPLAIRIKAGGNSSSKHPVFSLTVVPLLTGAFSTNNHGVITKTEAGTGVYGNITSQIGYAVSISKGFQSEQLAGHLTNTLEEGQNWNPWSGGKGYYINWTGQLIYSWKWGSFGLVKDRYTWGNNYHGASIFTDKAPSFWHIRLHLKPAKWIEFTYIHARLESNVIDSIRTFVDGDGSKPYYLQKYLVANMLTVTPWKYLDISFGNSAVYGDKLQAVYFIPVLFYKSVDHTLYPEPGLTGGTNAQMFFDISSRQIRHLHLFLTLFIDELKMSRITNPREHNFLGWKGGLRLSDFPVKNLSFTAEGTRTLPLTYQHNVPITTFQSDGYNLGNYLRDNAQEIFLSLDYLPLRGLHFSLSFNYADRGDIYDYETVANPTELPVLKNIIWSSRVVTFLASYELSTNASVFISFENGVKTGNDIFNSPSFNGKTYTLTAGINVGW